MARSSSFSLKINKKFRVYPNNLTTDLWVVQLKFYKEKRLIIEGNHLFNNVKLLLIYQQ